MGRLSWRVETLFSQYLTDSLSEYARRGIERKAEGDASETDPVRNVSDDKDVLKSWRW
jgi:hypothetical protein